MLPQLTVKLKETLKLDPERPEYHRATVGELRSGYHYDVTSCHRGESESKRGKGRETATDIQRERERDRQR